MGSVAESDLVGAGAVPADLLAVDLRSTPESSTATTTARLWCGTRLPTRLSPSQLPAILPALIRFLRMTTRLDMYKEQWEPFQP